MSNKTEIIPARDVRPLIHSIRDQRVILDTDLASLYQVPTKALNQAVRRNREKFPGDLLFQLTWEEAARLPSLRSQIVTLKQLRPLLAPPPAPPKPEIGFHVKEDSLPYRTKRRVS